MMASIAAFAINVAPAIAATIGATSVVAVPGINNTWAKHIEKSSDGSVYMSFNGWNGGAAGFARVDMSTNTLLYSKATERYGDQIWDIAVSLDAQNFYVAGNTTSGGFLASYLPDGTLAWEKPYQKATGGRFTIIMSVDVDASGNVYATYFNDTTTAYIYKYDSAGNQLWQLPIDMSFMWDNQNYLGVDFITVGDDGNLYLGYRTGSLYGCVSKMTASGQLLWTVDFGAPTWGTTEFINDMKVDANGNSYVSGTGVDDKGLITKYDTNGQVVWNVTNAVVSPYEAILYDGANNQVIYESWDAAGMKVIGAVDATTGAALWEQTIVTDGWLAGASFDLADDGSVLFGTSAYDGSATNIYGVPVQGQNVLIRFSQNGTIMGTSAADGIVGSPSANTINGGLGADNITPDPAPITTASARTVSIAATTSNNDTIDGNRGVDTVRYSGIASRYRMTRNTNGSWTIQDAQKTDGTDIIRNVEYVRFSDRTVTLSSVVNGTPNPDSRRGTNNPEIMQGLDGNDTLNSLGGNDEIYGGNGNDNMNAGPGDDFLDGGTGADVMHGGAGNDSYTINDPTDRTTENPNEGIDGIISLITHTLPTNIENLTLSGVHRINGTGNGLANVMQGNDSYNTMHGLNGDDILIGAGGADSLYGGIGKDVFKLLRITDSLPNSPDSIMDFEAANDMIDLSAIDAIPSTPANDQFIYIGSNAFGKRAGELRVSGGIMQADINGDGKADLAIRANVTAASQIVP
jgi:Ca2+-binding RTX toxin-like protein